MTRDLQNAQNELTRLREQRAEAQGRLVARGRTPREQRLLQEEIERTQQQIRNVEGIIRGFGGSPDPAIRPIGRLFDPRAVSSVTGGSPRQPRRRMRGQEEDPAAAPIDRPGGRFRRQGGVRRVAPAPEPPAAPPPDPNAP